MVIIEGMRETITHLVTRIEMEVAEEEVEAAEGIVEVELDTEEADLVVILEEEAISGVMDVQGTSTEEEVVVVVVVVVVISVMTESEELVFDSGVA